MLGQFRVVLYNKTKTNKKGDYNDEAHEKSTSRDISYSHAG